MLVVLARNANEAALEFRRRNEAFDIAILTPDDLAAPGWCVHTSDFRRSTAVVNGRTVSVCDITAVVTLLPSIGEADVPHVHRADRQYVAAEMHAFLLYWLSAMTTLHVPVFNPPCSPSLSSPAWDQLRVARQAASIGIPIQPVYLSTTDCANALSQTVPPNATAVTVVGSICVGMAHRVLMSHALALARSAEVELLTVWFDGPNAGSLMLGAEPWPDVARPEVANALIGLISNRHAGHRP